MNTSKTIVFFGSGPVAATALERLASDLPGFNIEAVVTKPRPAHHKGDVPVLRVAEELGLPIHTVSNKAELDSLIATKPFSSQLAVLIDFGIIVSAQAIASFPRGIVNSHFSLLPEWRGADPITFAVLSSQASTGVSLMLLVPAMDEGPLIAFAEQPLAADITTPQLTDQLIGLSHDLLKAHLPRYWQDGRSQPQTVTGRPVSYSHKLSKADGQLDWSKPAAVLEREVRAYAGWPKSYTQLGGLDIVVTQAIVNPRALAAGTVQHDGKHLLVGCGENSLEILQLKPAGKAAMTAQAFLAGYGRML